MSDNVIADWKKWHRELSDILGAEYLERTVTLNAAKELKRELATLREQLRIADEALEKYANKTNWSVREYGDGLDGFWYAREDGWRTATEALDEMRKVGG